MERNDSMTLGAPTCPCDLGISSPYTRANNVVAAALHVPSAIFAIVSNSVVILTVAKTRSLRLPANILLCSLALGDFMVGLVAQPVIMTMMMMQNAGVDCCLYNTAVEVFLYAMPIFIFGSLFQICVMCWDRYTAVSNPVNYRTSVTTRQMTALTAAAWIGWIAGIILLKVVIREAVRRIVALTTLALFITICGVSQVATLRAIRRINIRIAPIATAATFAREKKMAVTLRWILASLVLCALPFLVWNVSAPSSGGLPGHVLFVPWVRLGMCLSSSINPVIYFWRHGNMRRAAMGLIGR